MKPMPPCIISVISPPPRFAVTEVARRRTDELGNLVGVLKFRAIYLNDRAGIPKQDLGRCLHDAGLSGARWPEKEQVPYGPARRVQSGTKDLVHVHQGLYAFFLANNLGAQGSMKIPRIVATDARVQLMTDSSSHRFASSPRLLPQTRRASQPPREK